MLIAAGPAMTLESLKQQCQDLAQRVRHDHWPRLVHWLETHSPRSLFVRALLIGLLLSVPWQCSRWVYNAYFSGDENAVAESSGPLSAPGSLSGSITDMPNPRARRAPPPQAEASLSGSTADTSQPAADTGAAAKTPMGDHEASVLHRVAPKYPVSALRNNDSGTVTVSIQIDAEGKPDKIRIEKSSGSRDLDRAAREAVMQWQFSPKVENGVPVSSELLIPVEFKLGE